MIDERQVIAILDRECRAAGMQMFSPGAQAVEQACGRIIAEIKALSSVDDMASTAMRALAQQVAERGHLEIAALILNAVK